MQKKAVLRTIKIYKCHAKLTWKKVRFTNNSCNQQTNPQQWQCPSPHTGPGHTRDAGALLVMSFTNCGATSNGLRLLPYGPPLSFLCLAHKTPSFYVPLAHSKITLTKKIDFSCSAAAGGYMWARYNGVFLFVFHSIFLYT
jgi:hypothetical protein